MNHQQLIVFVISLANGDESTDVIKEEEEEEAEEAPGTTSKKMAFSVSNYSILSNLSTASGISASGVSASAASGISGAASGISATASGISAAASGVSASSGLSNEAVADQQQAQKGAKNRGGVTSETPHSNNNGNASGNSGRNTGGTTNGSTGTARHGRFASGRRMKSSSSVDSGISGCTSFHSALSGAAENVARQKPIEEEDESQLRSASPTSSSSSSRKRGENGGKKNNNRKGTVCAVDKRG